MISSNELGKPYRRKTPRSRGCTRLLAICVLSVALSVGCVGAATPSTVPGVAIPYWCESEPAVPSLFPVSQGGLWGFIDSSGQLVIEFTYEDAHEFSDGLAAVMVDGAWGYIDETGTEVIPAQFSTGAPFSDGLAVVSTPSGMGCIDRAGNLVIPPNPGMIDDGPWGFSEGLAPVVLHDGSRGYIDTSGKLILRMSEVDSIRDFSEGLAAVEGHGFGYVDRSGRYVIEPQFTAGAEEFSNGLAVVERDLGEFEIIDRAGNVVRQLDYFDVSGLSEGRAAVSVYDGEWPNGEGSWGYMDESGELVVAPRYLVAEDFHGGLARVTEKNGKMAYIDLSGNYVWREK